VKGRAGTWRTLFAGKGLHEDATNGAAARPVAAARESPRERKGGEPEALTPEARMSERDCQ